MVSLWTGARHGGHKKQGLISPLVLESQTTRRMEPLVHPDDWECKLSARLNELSDVRQRRFGAAINAETRMFYSRHRLDPDKRPALFREDNVEDAERMQRVASFRYDLLCHHLVVEVMPHFPANIEPDTSLKSQRIGMNPELLCGTLRIGPWWFNTMRMWFRALCYMDNPPDRVLKSRAPFCNYTEALLALVTRRVWSEIHTKPRFMHWWFEKMINLGMLRRHTQSEVAEQLWVPDAIAGKLRKGSIVYEMGAPSASAKSLLHGERPRKNKRRRKTPESRPGGGDEEGHQACIPGATLVEIDTTDLKERAWLVSACLQYVFEHMHQSVSLVHARRMHALANWPDYVDEPELLDTTGEGYFWVNLGESRASYVHNPLLEWFHAWNARADEITSNIPGKPRDGKTARASARPGSHQGALVEWLGPLRDPNPEQHALCMLRFNRALDKGADHLRMKERNALMTYALEVAPTAHSGARWLEDVRTKAAKQAYDEQHLHGELKSWSSNVRRQEKQDREARFEKCTGCKKMQTELTLGKGPACAWLARDGSVKKAAPLLSNLYGKSSRLASDPELCEAIEQLATPQSRCTMLAEVVKWHTQPTEILSIPEQRVGRPVDVPTVVRHGSNRTPVRPRMRNRQFGKEGPPSGLAQGYQMLVAALKAKEERAERNRHLNESMTIELPSGKMEM